MLRKIFLTSFVLIIFIGFKLANINSEVYAQCSGSATGCYDESSCDESVIPNRCVDEGRQCMTQACVNVGGGNCGWTAWVNDSCQEVNGGCQLGNGAPFGIICGPVAPPPPPPTCPNGVCNNTENCSTCPQDCGACPPGSTPGPPGGGSCSGSGGCQGGIANCGAIGRNGGSGSCGPGEICCGDIIGSGSGGYDGCSVQGVSPSGVIRMAVNQVLPVTQTSFEWGGWPTHMAAAGWKGGNALVARATGGGNMCCGWFWGSRSIPGNITAYGPGATVVSAYCVASDDKGDDTWPVSVIVDGTQPYLVVEVTPSPVDLPVGQTQVLTATLTEVNGSLAPVQNVRFTSSVPARASVTPVTPPGLNPDDTPPYETTVTALFAWPNNITITARVTLTDGNVFVGTGIVRVINQAEAWWQVEGGSVTSGGPAGGIISLIPDTCVLPGCNPAFILNGTNNTAGSAIYGGTANSYDFANNATRGVVSSSGWIANARHVAPVYDFAYARGLIQGKINPTVFNGNFNGPSVNGYEWYESSGDVNMNNPATVGANERVVLFVNGDLNVNARMNLAQPQSSFFLAIVSGDINIAPGVTNNGPNAALQGICIANGTINTGTGNLPLTFQGAVVALGGINLGRDLLSGNFTNPAEVFQHDPRQLLNFPPDLSRDSVIWREVAP